MKLHIGGQEIKEGWKILDIQKTKGVDFVGDISDLSQFEDSSIEEIYASHVFEHVHQKKIKETLLGINRVLKKDAKLFISVPDLNILFHFFLNPLINKRARWDTLRIIFGGQTDEHDYHYFGWNFELLNDSLKEAGFSKIERVSNFNLFNDTSNHKVYGFPISLNIIAYK
tara:strand:+ start:184 stop:693 length:510 start_codon:yes stop_codon:yes gene_type:complete